MSLYPNSIHCHRWPAVLEDTTEPEEIDAELITVYDDYIQYGATLADGTVLEIRVPREMG